MLFGAVDLMGHVTCDSLPPLSRATVQYSPPTYHGIDPKLQIRRIMARLEIEKLQYYFCSRK